MRAECRSLILAALLTLVLLATSLITPPTAGATTLSTSHTYDTASFTCTWARTWRQGLYRDTFTCTIKNIGSQYGVRMSVSTSLDEMAPVSNWKPLLFTKVNGTTVSPSKRYCTVKTVGNTKTCQMTLSSLPTHRHVVFVFDQFSQYGCCNFGSYWYLSR